MTLNFFVLNETITLYDAFLYLQESNIYIFI